MNILLPHRFKKIGAIMASMGLVFWIVMQKGLVTSFITWCFDEDIVPNQSPYHFVNVAVAIISFFSFLIGLYFLSFTKEKFEDEMIQKVRLDSFQFAALVQMVLIIVGFLIVLIFGDPGAEGMLLFFIGQVFIFWLCFIVRLNYILHVRLKYMDEK